MSFIDFEALFEEAPGFMAVLNGPNHVFAVANGTFRRLVGDRALLGRTVREALPEIAGQGLVASLDRLRDTGRPFAGRRIRIRITHGSGAVAQERYVDFVGQPIVGPDGTLAAIFVQGHDVTEQKRAEDALRESEARFRLVADSAPVMLWMGDHDGKCIYLNRALREFWGLAPEAIADFDWNTTLHPDDHGDLFEPFSRAMQQRTSFTVEARFRRADGTYRVVHTDAQPRFGTDGQFLGMIGVNVDVTETRRAETALRNETRQLEILNRTGATLAAELDLDRIVQTVTEAGVELAGAQFGAFFYNVLNEKGESYMLYALAGRPREAFAKFPMPRATAVFRPTFHGLGIIRSDDILQDPRYGQSEPYRGMPAGHLPVRSYLAIPVTSRSGEVLGGLFFGHAETGRFKQEHETLLVGIAGQAAIAIDNARLFRAAENELVERRRAEEALQVLNATLEQRVAEEVEERSKVEEALRQAQKMEAVGQLTGGIAHDFNNLLQGITGSLNIIQQRIRQGRIGELDRWVTGAMASAQRAASLTHRLLAFSRRQPLDPKPVDANPLVASMEDLLRRTMGEGVQVELHLAAELWTTLCDPNQLESAVLNLAINARDAMPDGGRLAIETTNGDVDPVLARQLGIQPGQYVCVSVTDTGIGMTPNILERAFDPFFTTKPTGQGTGLGLSMIYGFARQSEGFAKLFSEVGRGTAVRLYLPRHRGQAEDESLPPELLVGRQGEGEIVLVVEDEVVVRGLIVEAMQELGYRALEASDGPAGLEILRSSQRLDLLITDVGLPGLNGRQLADAGREIRRNLKVLFMTGYAENAAIANGFLGPGMALITKPFSMELLANRVREMIAER